MLRNPITLKTLRFRSIPGKFVGSSLRFQAPIKAHVKSPVELASQSFPNDLERTAKEHLETAVKWTKFGAVSNLMLASGKGLVGVLISSSAMISDAANSFGDILCDAVVYFSLQEARKSATPERPW